MANPEEQTETSENTPIIHDLSGWSGFLISALSLVALFLGVTKFYYAQPLYMRDLNGFMILGITGLIWAAMLAGISFANNGMSWKVVVVLSIPLAIGTYLILDTVFDVDLLGFFVEPKGECIQPSIGMPERDPKTGKILC